jgi:hypothetical protein
MGRFVGYVLEQSWYIGIRIETRGRTGAEAYVNQKYETYSDREHAIYKTKYVMTHRYKHKTFEI